MHGSAKVNQRSNSLEMPCGHQILEDAFRHASTYRAETWHGGRGRAPEVCGHIFEGTPSWVKGHPGVNLP